MNARVLVIIEIWSICDLGEIIEICFQHRALTLSIFLSCCGISKFRNKVVVPVS
jgi:hypothetical protein